MDIGGFSVASKDLPLLGLPRVSQHYFHKKPIQLGLGQRVSALLFNRILGGHHHKTFGQRQGFAVDAHLSFLHGLKKRGLGLWWRPVDFVAQKNFGKNWTLAKMKLPTVQVVNLRAQNVCGHQVGSELDSGKL